MKLSSLIRQAHRWVSITFIVTVAMNFTALALKRETVWVGVLALLPLALLGASGLYLFVLPYATKRPRAENARELA